MSKLHYIMSSLEIDKDFVVKVQRAVNDFVWNSSKPKIKQAVAQQNMESGGLSVPNIDMYIKANRIGWIKRLLCKDSRNMQFLKMFIPRIDLFHFIKCNYNPKDLPSDIPTFYFQVLYAWFSLKEEPKNPLDIRRNYIVFNQHIGIGGKYVYQPSLIKNNVLLINDFVDKHGKLKDPIL